MMLPINQLLCKHSQNPAKYTGLYTGTDKKWVRDYHPITSKNLIVHTALGADGKTVYAHWDAMLPP